MYYSIFSIFQEKEKNLCFCSFQAIIEFEVAKSVVAATSFSVVFDFLPIQKSVNRYCAFLNTMLGVKIHKYLKSVV